MYSKLVLIFLVVRGSSTSSNTSLEELYRTVNLIKECFRSKYPGVCFKEKALTALNETMMSDVPVRIGFIEIRKNPVYEWNSTIEEDDLPEEDRERSLVLSDALSNMLVEYVKSRIVKFNMDSAFEGRKKGGGGGGGGGGLGGGGGGGGGKGGGAGMMLAAGVSIVCLGAGMMMGKVGMMAGAAMMMSKMALIMSTIMIIKKMKGDGGGGDEGGKKEVKIIYATTGGDGGGGGYGKGGGGWHRSLDAESQALPYRFRASNAVDANYLGGY